MEWLFRTSGYTPRGIGAGWHSSLFTLNRIADLTICIECGILGVLLILLAFRESNFSTIPRRGLVLALALFIGAGSFTHLMLVIETYIPLYNLATVTEFLQAVCGLCVISLTLPVMGKLNVK